MDREVCTSTNMCNLVIPNYSNNLLMELNKLRLNNKCCDAEISTNEGFVNAHKIVMCSASPYFRERLTMKSDHFDKIYLENTSLLLVNLMVEFIYTGKLHLQQDLLDPMMQLLDRIKMKDVGTVCVESKHCENISSSQSISATRSDPCGSMVHQTFISDSDASNNRSRKRRTLMVRNYTSEVGEVDAGKTEEKIKHGYDCLENGQKDCVPRLTITFGKKDDNTWQSEMADTTREPATPSDGLSPGKNSLPLRRKKDKAADRGCKTLKAACRTKRQLKCATKTQKTLHKNRMPSLNNRKSTGNELALIRNDIHCKGDDIKDEVDSEQSTDSKDSYTTNDKEEMKDWPSQNTMPVDNEVKSNCYKHHVKPNHTPDIDSIVCKVCKIELPNQEEYLTHTKAHKQEKKTQRSDGKQKVWPCTVCSKNLTSLVRHACHEYSKHGIPYESKLKLHACTFEGCKYITASKHYLQIHTRGRHGNERPHVCEYCGKGFKLPSALVTHLNIHTNKKKYECEECKMTFNQKGGLDIHIKKHHRGQQSWSELCHLCSDKFLHKADLCWHLFNNHGQPVPDRYQIFTCDLCDYKTIRKNKLDRHMDSHEDKRSWVCNLCGKKFVTKSYLNRHVKYHGEKTYICVFDDCNYASVDQVGLKKHVRLMHTHKNYKPFTCTMCSYKTGLRGNLDKHIRTVHNLEVVTKHTVHLKVKFKDRRSGDIITKDGHLVQSASQRDCSESKREFQILEEFSEPNNKEAPPEASFKVKRTGARRSGKGSHRKTEVDALFTSDMIPEPHLLKDNDGVDIQSIEPANILQTEQQQHQQHYLQNQCIGLANHLQLPFPMATNSRMASTNQVSVNPVDMFLNIDQMSGFKYQEFYE